MKELGLDVAALADLFDVAQEAPYALILMPADKAAVLADVLGAPLRLAYVSDKLLDESHRTTGVARRELVRAKLPDPGATMSGDFGEFLTSLLHAVLDSSTELLDPKKLRLKQDRTKPAPKSDVVQFIVPRWPEASVEDLVLCSEVKSKALKGTSRPIQEALADSAKDREGRLIKTLVWLRERLQFEPPGTVTVEHLRRFIDAVDYPPAQRVFRAVAVISSDLIDGEVAGFDVSSIGDDLLVLVSVPNLKSVYESVFEAAARSADEWEAPGETRPA